MKLFNAIALVGILAVATTAGAQGAAKNSGSGKQGTAQGGARQGGGRPAGTMGGGMVDMGKFLGLSKAQQAKVEALGKKSREDRQKIYANKNLTREQKYAQMRKLTTDYQKEFKKILTKQQLAKFEAREKAMRAQIEASRKNANPTGAAGGGGGGGGRRGG